MKKLLNITFARFVTLCTLLVAPFYSFAAEDLPYYCPDRKYTSCNTGYYMTFGGVYNGTPQLGNSCDECPVGCTCAGGTAAPACAHSVSYKCDADGDIYQTDKVIYMAEYHTLAEVCEKPGYYHTKWYDSENITNKLNPDDDLEWPYETDKTFIAEYIPNTFNVSYAGNGNTGGVAPSAPSAPTACTYDATCVAPANTYTRDGYTFTGWKCTGGDASCDDDIIQPGTSISNATTVFNGTIKMTAQWQENTYKMAYSCGSGTDIEGGLDTLKDINVVYGNEYTFANGNQECHRDGYTFAGWQTYIDGQIVTKQSGDKYTWTYAGDLLWTAQWQENTYTITYDIYGSEDVMYNGSLPDAPEIPTKRGYTFNGWWTQTSGGTQYYNASNTPVINKYTLKDDLMLYAQWTPITYTVYYNDGANIAEAQCTYGTPCVVQDATRTGYDLTGWVCISDIMNCDEDTLIQPQTDLNTYIKEGATSGQSVDMVAVWQAKKYTCVPGKYLNGTKCLDCTPGAYCPGVTDIPYDGGTHGFEDCPDDGSSPNNAEKRTQCYIIEKCTDGGDGTRTCHYETKGYTNCTACEYNTCDKGYYKNGQTCDICPVGYSCDGTYNTICDTGTYADKQGQETCTPCPQPYTQTDSRGATSATQCYATCDVSCEPAACNIENVKSCEYESRKIGGIKYNDEKNTCQTPSDANLTCAITGFTCMDGYAKNGNLCEPIEYKIKYVLDGGTNDDSNPTTYTVEHLPITLQDATRIGYMFAGWTDDNGNTVSTIATGTTGNITLTAQWDDCGVGNWCANGVKTSCTEYGANYTTDSANAKSADECYQPCTVACIEPECPSGMNCDYETKSTDGKQYWNSNTCDAVPSVCDFIVSCKPAFEMIAGQCEPCMREHALSYKDTGNCLIETCEDGYYPDGTECRNAVIDCTDIKPNATHATQTWLNTGFGKCVVHECDSGYHVEDNNCVADEMPCDLDNGTGLKTWNPVTRTWNTCTVVECMPGYTNDPTLTNENWKQCGRCNNMYGDDGVRVASSYIHECEIASCFYQGERYILEDNECRLICDEYSDETGHRYWDDKRKKCVHDCNIGYNPW